MDVILDTDQLGSAVRAARRQHHWFVSARETFSGGVAVITGAGSGIGAGLARYASRLGMTVVLADVDADADRFTARRIAQPEARPSTVVCDVRDPDAMQELAERTYRDIGPVRLLVNNAGVEQFGYLWDTPVDNWNRVVDINISGVFYGVQCLSAEMMATGEHAWVWNLSSIGGVVAIPLQAPYIMSKHAVLAITECLRLEVELAGHPNHIHVQAVLPGAVVSNIFESAGGVDSSAMSGPPIATRRHAGHQGRRHGSVAAAETVFEQAAAGTLLSGDPTVVVAAMAERAKFLSPNVPPALTPMSRPGPGS